MTDKQRISVYAALASAAFLIGVFDLPYSYYMLMRFGIFALAILLALQFHESLPTPVLGLLVAVAILYNPFLPIHLGDKTVWMGVNIATAVLIWSLLYFVKSDEKKGDYSSYWTPEEIREARIQLQDHLKVSNQKPIPQFDELEMKSNCGKCGKRFKFISGKITILENKDGQPVLLCKECFVELNGWRVDLGLEKFPFDEDAYPRHG